MAKRQLKTRILREQGVTCALSSLPLPSNLGLPAASTVRGVDLPLVDTDRILPKAEGGTYTDENTRVVLPTAHMYRHGNLRERELALDLLKSIFDDRVQTMKLHLKVNNQMLAYARRTDKAHPETQAWLQEMGAQCEARLDLIDKHLGRAIKTYPDPLAQAALQVPGLGPITVAALAVYVDFQKQVCCFCHRRADDEECEHRNDVGYQLVSATANASSLWKYAGLDKPSHERYAKGVKGGGNKTLRTVLWNAVNSMVKMGERCAYREVYDRTKAKLEKCEHLVQSRNTQGRLVEVMWKDAKPSHRHGAALRAMMKHLLADYWMVGRQVYGLPARALYVQEHLGHTHIVSPRERGWNY